MELTAELYLAPFSGLIGKDFRREDPTVGEPVNTLQRSICLARVLVSVGAYRVLRIKFVAKYVPLPRTMPGTEKPFRKIC